MSSRSESIWSSLTQHFTILFFNRTYFFPLTRILKQSGSHKRWMVHKQKYTVSYHISSLNILTIHPSFNFVLIKHFSTDIKYFPLNQGCREKRERERTKFFHCIIAYQTISADGDFRTQYIDKCNDVHF